MFSPATFGPENRSFFFVPPTKRPYRQLWRFFAAPVQTWRLPGRVFDLTLMLFSAKNAKEIGEKRLSEKGLFLVLWQGMQKHV
jgi:hypothetical protein